MNAQDKYKELREALLAPYPPESIELREWMGMRDLLSDLDKARTQVPELLADRKAAREEVEFMRTRIANDLIEISTLTQRLADAIEKPDCLTCWYWGSTHKGRCIQEDCMWNKCSVDCYEQALSNSE